jgi:GGDEF domain-containing protein
MNESVANIYVIPKHQVAFTDYDELIRYVRRNKLDDLVIFSTRANSWNEMQDSVNIIETVLADAYNDFDHFKDTNYRYEDREAVRALKLIGIKIYESQS